MRFLVLASLLSGCAFTQTVDIDTIIVDRVIREYHDKADLVRVGDEKSAVLNTLPSQGSLGEYGRRPITYLDDKQHRIDIFFYRSRRIPDEVATDDEFVPYTFVDDYLTWIGWSALDGERTFARCQAAAPLERDRYPFLNLCPHHPPPEPKP